MKEQKLADGRDRIVRHGHGPERSIQTGIGPVTVSRVKLRDRGAGQPGAERITFTSAILPRWARRTRSLDALLPVLYLRGISTGDFQEALAALLGKAAPNLSPAVIAQLKGEWADEYEHWQDRDLSARRYVYLWAADGVYLQARMEPRADCMLVLIGATPEGRKELVGLQVGVRESAQSWRELLTSLKARGLGIAPEMAVGDGALGYWKNPGCPATADPPHPRSRATGDSLQKASGFLEGSARSMTKGSVTASTRKAATRIVVFQCPRGTRPISREPRRQRFCRRAMAGGGRLSEPWICERIR